MEAIEIKSQIHNYNIILHDNVKDLIKKELDSSAKYFVVIDNKISMDERDMWPVVVDSDEKVVWLPGLKKSKFDKSKDENYDIILRYY